MRFPALSHRPLAALAGTLLAVPLFTASAQVDARLMRYPALSQRHVAFVYAGDVWVGDRNGGAAARIASPAGEESFPRFSPDGTQLAFSGNYDGNTDLYVMPAGGGVPRRVTYHPAEDRLLGWSRDGKSLLFASGRESARNRFSQLYRISVNGGLPEKLPVPYGELADISPDGRTLAYQPKWRDMRTWKRYRGGMAPDIWLFNLETFASENLTNSVANESHPMFSPDGKTLYLLSDRGAEERFNLYAVDLATRQYRQLTRFTDDDITFPSMGPDAIIFQAGGRLYRLPLAGGEAVVMNVQAVTDNATLRPRTESVGDEIAMLDLSPTGKRVFAEARGEIFSVPAEHGPTRNLTATSGIAERHPAWSPDGTQVAYWSDRSGEYELVIRSADGSGAERTVTKLGPGFRYRLFWSPDGKSIATIDQTERILVIDVASGRVREAGKQLYHMHGALMGFEPSWSPDSRWLTWAQDEPGQRTSIRVWDAESGQATALTSGFYQDGNPVFDPAGKYLYYTSNRDNAPSYSDRDNTWAYVNSTRILAVPLRKDVPSPLAPRSDEEGKAEPKADAAKAPNGNGGAANAPAPVNIDLDGFEARAVVLPPRAGNYAALFAAKGKIIFHRAPNTGSGERTAPVIQYDLASREETPIVDNATRVQLSRDGNSLLVGQPGNRYAIVKAQPRQKVEGSISFASMETRVDPKAEWKQIFADAWRFERDFFYDKNMHGVDWNALRTHYGAILEDAVTRWDVNFLLGELVGELDASHTYVRGGDTERAQSRAIGMLGVDWEKANGAYRIARVLRGAPWDADARSPLDVPGVNVGAGDYVLAVNGVTIDPAQEPFAAFEGLANTTVELLVNGTPTTEGARRVLVTTVDMGDEAQLRYRAWVEANRQKVLAASNGRIGYVYVPSTGVDGQTELFRMFHGQRHMDGLIIDERFNSGGQIPDRFVELLNRPPMAYWAVRDGRDWEWPPAAHLGPKAMLANGWSGSGGDAFPFYFKQAKLGPLIGERTWGGLIGISGAPQLVDGGSVTVPTFRMYDPDGTWFPEGRGVEPDIAVVDDPTAMAKGGDPQLERAIAEVMAALERGEGRKPPRPGAERRTVANDDNDNGAAGSGAASGGRSNPVNDPVRPH